jgi:hypothetical protein
MALWGRSRPPPNKLSPLCGRPAPGRSPAKVYFNILVARVYRRLLAILDGRGVLFAIEDDVEISAPPLVTDEIVEIFDDIAWTDAGLTTQVVINRIYVQPSLSANFTPSAREIREMTPRFIGDALYEEELMLATQLIRGHTVVEVQGRWSKNGDLPPEPITLPNPRSLSEYSLAPCRHKGGIIKQTKHAKQAFAIFTGMGPIKRTLMKASLGQCGLDSAHRSPSTV